jgi:hypothetical protein
MSIWRHSQTRIPAKNIKHECQYFQVDIGDNHWRSRRYWFSSKIAWPKLRKWWMNELSPQSKEK